MEVVKKGPKGPRTVLFSITGFNKEKFEKEIYQQVGTLMRDDAAKIAQLAEKYVIQEQVFSPEDTNPDNFTLEQASEIFEKKHQVKPLYINGPLFQKKRALLKNIKLSYPEIDNSQLDIIPNSKVEAVFEGWKGWAFDIVDNQEAVYFVPINQIEENARKTIKAQPVFRANLQF